MINPPAQAGWWSALHGLRVFPAAAPGPCSTGRGWWAGLVLMAAVCTAAAVEISPEEALEPPRPSRAEELIQVAAVEGWPAIEAAARDAALRAAEQQRHAAMEGWLLLTRWARLLDEREGVATQRWAAALNAARLGHENMASHWELRPERLAERLRPSVAARLLGDVAFSRVFFEQLSPYDHLPRVLAILDELAAADPARFATYRELALAIALVYDVPPPPHWPHQQVAPAILPRRLPEPAEAFAFWTTADRQRLTLHRLAQLPAAELKFVVSAAAPDAELQWVRTHARHSLAELPRAYDAVRYRTDRIEAGAFTWPGRSYALPLILAEGGICVDQAYFASEVGKALGVPTLLFSGAGRDGRHAWFGFLGADQRWQLDVGRYAEQRYVVGVAIDPQTWGDINDHELAFLAERFRLLPAYRQSRAQVLLAQELLRLGRTDEAVAAARRAVNHERRHVAAWDTLIASLEAQGATGPVREAALRDAARAFQRHPDLNARYQGGVIAVLRERGQTSAAEHEERLLAQKFAGRRDDLAAAQAAEMLNRSLAEDDPVQQMRTFERVLVRYGGGAGIHALDRLVRPFVHHLRRTGRTAEVPRAIATARRVLSIRPGTQFDRELAALERG